MDNTTNDGLDDVRDLAKQLNVIVDKLTANQAVIELLLSRVLHSMNPRQAEKLCADIVASAGKHRLDPDATRELEAMVEAARETAGNWSR